MVGQHCESGDILARDALLPSDLSAGDLVCSLVTGAYGYSMASTYNRLGRPARRLRRQRPRHDRATPRNPHDMMNLDAWPPSEPVASPLSAAEES